MMVMSHTSRRLTPRPRVPVLVHVAALGLVGAPGCGDDGTGETIAASTTVDDGLDDHPTACHDDPSCNDGFLDSSTGIESTGTGATSTGATGTDDSGTGPLPDDTSSTSGDMGTGTSGTGPGTTG